MLSLNFASEQEVYELKQEHESLVWGLEMLASVDPVEKEKLEDGKRRLGIELVEKLATLQAGVVLGMAEVAAEELATLEAKEKQAKAEAEEQEAKQEAYDKQQREKQEAEAKAEKAKQEAEANEQKAERAKQEEVARAQAAKLEAEEKLRERDLLEMEKVRLADEEKERFA